MRNKLRWLITVGMTLCCGFMMDWPAMAIEITDEKGDRWTDITEAVGRWPLNTFNTMYISEYDFEENRIGVVLNTVGWEADEIVLAWQNYAGVLNKEEFAALSYDEVSDRYIPLGQFKVDEDTLNSGVEVILDGLDSRLTDYFYTKKLVFMARSREGNLIQPDYNSYFACGIELKEGEVCRLFYRDPIPGGGTSSGLTKYFPVRKREVAEETEETETVDEMVKVEEAERADETVEAEEAEKTEDAGDIVEDAVKEMTNKNEDGDINNANDGQKLPDIGRNYSSGDIFNEVSMFAASNSSNNGPSGSAMTAADSYLEEANNIVNNGSKVSGVDEDTVALIRRAELGKNGEEEIEVPRLGATARKIDYKWLFLPILGLVLVIYWWFFVPIYKKRQKNEKKSKKSVDNI